MRRVKKPKGRVLPLREAAWAMYSAGMEVAAKYGRGIPDHRDTFLAGFDAGASSLGRRRS